MGGFGCLPIRINALYSTLLFGMHNAPRRRVVIKCKPNVNFSTMSSWVSIHI